MISHDACTELSLKAELSLCGLVALANIGGFGFAIYLATLDWSDTFDASSDFAVHAELFPVMTFMMAIASILFLMNAYGKKLSPDKAPWDKMRPDKKAGHDFTSIGEIKLPHLFIGLGSTALTLFYVLGIMQDASLWIDPADRTQDVVSAVMCLFMFAMTATAYYQATPVLMKLYAVTLAPVVTGLYACFAGSDKDKEVVKPQVIPRRHETLYGQPPKSPSNTQVM